MRRLSATGKYPSRMGGYDATVFASAFRMRMPVVNIGKVRVAVLHRFVLMGVRMRFIAVPIEVMAVLVVRIVPVFMRVR